MVLNPYPNFLKWTDGNPEPRVPLPNGYWKDRERCGYMPIAYPTEVMSFYINTETGLTYSTFSDLALRIHDARNGDIVAADVGTLEQHFFLDSTTNYNIYSTFVIPALENGIYYLSIYRIASGVEVCRSSMIRAVNDFEKLKNETVYARFKHDRLFYGIRYHDIPDFYQQFRLNITIIDEQPEEEINEYKESTTGIVRTYEGAFSWTYVLESYYFNASAHKAAFAMYRHNFVELNGTTYTAKDAYKIATNNLTKLNKGQITVFDNSFTAIDRCV